MMIDLVIQKVVRLKILKNIVKFQTKTKTDFLIHRLRYARVENYIDLYPTILWGLQNMKLI